ncbi:unnamed protein product (macronuclear) [Paramecium tetraurelia]|uniref:Transmembrane protein n=1 Tax=Paramecium tetraurelia TaxID=5888 RepID=A0D5M6_PARTE|nr:uncharacterized protein GSPATT00013773001 [Paramecium tetraurelia]CAK78343.1 unnamed protein product [Paramecium tetraurelia]|eukprot:XP_001445740.1 hypothetical protein (macronuclear) [Paramecium tetraurelia strain d4-2]
MVWGQEVFLIEHSINDNTIFVVNKKAISIINSKNAISYQIKPSDYYENSQIRFCIEQQNFIIISKNIIKAFHYDKIIELKWSLRITKEINKIIQNNQVVSIYLQDCLEIFIQIDILKYEEINNSLQFGCKFKPFDQQEIRISNKEIEILPYFSNKVIFNFDQIIDYIYFVNQERLVIFEVIEKKIVLKLYSIQFQDLYFFFNLPLYDFTIIYPLRYEIFWDQLAIAAKNPSNQQEVLLVYNLNNQLISILIKVINIDQNQYYFTFLNVHQIVSIYNSSLMVTYLKQVFLKFTDQYLDFDTDFKHELNYLEAKTDIFNLSKIVQFDIVISHFNYTLKIKDNKIPFLQHYHKQKQINKINFENVFNQIDNVYLLRENDFQKLVPIVITPFLECGFYSNQACYKDTDVILFNSVNQIMIKLPQSCKDLVFIKDLSSMQEIFCLASGMFLEKYEVNQIQLNKKSQYQQSLQIDFYADRIQSIIFIENIAIIKIMNKKQYQILLFQENDLKQFSYKDRIDFQIVQVIYVKNHYVIFCYDNKINHLIHVVLLTQNYSNDKTLEIDISQMITEYFSLGFLHVNSLLILNHTLNYMIFETNIIICFIAQNCFRINLIIDFQQSLMHSHIINFIRYQHNKGQLQYCLANQNTLILSLLMDEETVIYFYNLSSIKVLDSLYQYVEQNTTIEYFNESHFVQIKSVNTTQQLSFVQFQGYQFQPQNPFKQTIETIKLNNSVSTLTLVFYPSFDRNDIINFSNMRISLINLVNLILLILFLKTFKNRRFRHQIK